MTESKTVPLKCWIIFPDIWFLLHSTLLVRCIIINIQSVLCIFDKCCRRIIDTKTMTLTFTAPVHTGCPNQPPAPTTVKPLLAFKIVLEVAGDIFLFPYPHPPPFHPLQPPPPPPQKGGGRNPIVSRNGIFKLLRSPRIDSKESIPQAYVA